MTAQALKESNVKIAALLGTKYTMEENFLKSIIADHGVEVLIPNETERKKINDIIFNELCMGEIKEKSRNVILEIIENLGREGAEGIILGCTEIGLLIKQSDTAIPLFDTTQIHAESAAIKAIFSK